MKETYFDVIIIGAGAAGMMCAIEAGKRGRSVLILEHNDTVGKKIRISGGGRCNFTNIHATHEHFISQNPHFCKSALARYTPNDFCDFVRNHNIAFHEKKLGQLFCDKSAQLIIDALKRDCTNHHVHIIDTVKVKSVKKEGPFHLTTSIGNFTSESLVIATGGLSIPSLGATDFGYAIAKQFDINRHDCKPGLVPLTLNEKDLSVFKELAGVSVDVIVSIKKRKFHENILFTHRGLSGPAILKISSYWQENTPITINFLPSTNLLKLFVEHKKHKTTLQNVLIKPLPTRLAKTLCKHIVANKPMNAYCEKERDKVIRQLTAYSLTPSGTEGYAKAEVTVGGVDTNELSSKTMEAKKVPKLYFIGEVVDVTGHLGGFNFQWAWSSAVAAGNDA